MNDFWKEQVKAIFLVLGTMVLTFIIFTGFIYLLTSITK